MPFLISMCRFYDIWFQSTTPPIFHQNTLVVTSCGSHLNCDFSLTLCTWLVLKSCDRYSRSVLSAQVCRQLSMLMSLKISGFSSISPCQLLCLYPNVRLNQCRHHVRVCLLIIRRQVKYCHTTFGYFTCNLWWESTFQRQIHL